MKNKKTTRSFDAKNQKTPTRKPSIQVSIAITFTISTTLTLLLFSKETITILPMTGFHSNSQNFTESQKSTLSETIQPNQTTQERILDKVAEINRLNQILHGLPVLPLEMRRPTSIEIKSPANVPIEEQQRENEKSLDQELKRLQMLLQASSSNNG
jgi:subtilisin-like proprotein convertase family protein